MTNEQNAREIVFSLLYEHTVPNAMVLANRIIDSLAEVELITPEDTEDDWGFV